MNVKPSKTKKKRFNTIKPQQKTLESEQSNEEETIVYNGKTIKRGADLLEFLDLQLINKENIHKANTEYKDELFHQLLDNLLPSKDMDYTKMGVGDIMFNLEQADQLTYDIVDEAGIKKKRAEELAREKER